VSLLKGARASAIDRTEAQEFFLERPDEQAA
jgi:hypothetical protein